MTSTMAHSTKTPSPILGDVFIRASAGTGKTFQLSTRFIQLLLAGRSVDQILATTFTRKAAGEILERVMGRVADGAASPEKCRTLAEELNLTELTCGDCRSVLRMLTGNLHRLRIATLDAFFLQATQSLSLELGLPARSQIVDEFDEMEIRDEAIRRLIEHEDAQVVTQLMHSLTKGETRRGVHELVRETVSAAYEVFLETSRDAWCGLKRQATLSAQQRSEAIETLRNIDLPATLRRAVELNLGQAADEDWDAFVSKGIAAKIVIGESYYWRNKIPDEILPAYRRLADHAVAELRNRVALQTESTYELLEKFHRHFETVKDQRRALLFSDLPRRLAGISAGVHLDHVSYRLDASVESLLLDEFQDTSLFQWQVIRPFARHVARNGAGDFLCVGDEKQAIYGWRGGNADLLRAARNELNQTDEMTLNESHRSAQPVIDFVNRVNQRFAAHQNLGEAQRAVQEWASSFPQHSTARDTAGYVSVFTSELADDNQVQHALTLQRAVERVRELSQKAPHASIALLVRTNENVGRLIHKLHREGIPASEEGGNPLTDSAAVQLVLSLLSLADHPGDTVARFHLQRSPWASQLGLDGDVTERQVEELASTVRELLIDVGYGHAIGQWAQQLKPYCSVREWRRLSQLVELAHVYQHRVEMPQTIGLQLQSRASLRCDAFIWWIQHQKLVDPSEDRVRVMTIHQAKGLQFDHVVLPDLDRNLLPQAPLCVVHRKGATEPIDLVCRHVGKEIRRLLPPRIQQAFETHVSLSAREELCVLYVALTRACQGLDLVIAPSKSSEKQLPRTLAGLFRAALTEHQPLPPNQLVHQDGEPQWYARKPISSRSASDAVTCVTQIELAKTPASITRSADVSRPSSLEGDGRIRLRDRLSRPNATAMQHGSLMHAFLEQVTWIDDGMPDESLLVDVARQTDADERLVSESLAIFRKMLSNPQVKTVLSRDFYADRLGQLGNGVEIDVRCEQPLMAVSESGILSGSIDRLVLFKRQGRPVAADVVDYKTDSVRDAAELRARVEHYQPQLNAYINGVHHMLRIPLDQVSGRLLFLNR